MSVWVTVDKAKYGSSGDTLEVTFNDFTLTTCSDENMPGAAEKLRMALTWSIPSQGLYAVKSEDKSLNARVQI